MLKFVSSYLALSYLGFSAVAVAGLLQVLAAWRSLVGFALLDYRRRPAWRRALGPLLIVVAYAWFFGTRREILTPGLAGAELTLLFGGGVLIAVALTLIGASILRPYRWSPARARVPAPVQARTVRLSQGQEAVLFQDPGQSKPGPGICLLPDPNAASGQLYALAGRLAQQGSVVLLPTWDEALRQYPDVLALAPTAMAFLSRQPLVDPDRLVIGGVGLGGDLALRAAAEDRRMRAIFALAPLWEQRHSVPSLGLLHEMTYPEAIRWGLQGRRAKLLRQLASPEALGRIGSRPVLILYGNRDAIVRLTEVQTRLENAGSAVEVRIVPGEGHLSLAPSLHASSIVSQWLAESL